MTDSEYIRAWLAYATYTYNCGVNYLDGCDCHIYCDVDLAEDETEMPPEEKT